MPGRLQRPSLCCILLIPSLVVAQQLHLSTEDMEDLLYRGENVMETEYLDDPDPRLMDLNSSSSEELEETGLFTAYQLNNLLKYREEYGEIYSIYELAAIPGFRPSKVMELQSFMMAAHENQQNGKIPRHHLFMIDTGRTFPDSEAEREDSVTVGEPAFAGSRFKTTIRIKSRPLEKLSLGLTYDKDSGEPFLYRDRPQFLSGYLAYSGDRYLKQAVVGNFQMNQGLGLVNGTGFFQQAGKIMANWHSLARLRPSSSKSESRFKQGAAFQLEFQKVKLLAWLSCQHVALSPAAFSENTDAIQWLEYERTSGLFRSTGELEGRDLAFRVQPGIQALYRHNQLAAGFMYSPEWIFPTKKARKYLTTDPDPSMHQNASLHGCWQKNRIQVSGELAYGGYHSMALLFGTQYYFNDFIQAGWLLHHYGAYYRGSNPSSYGSSNIRNEQGIAFYLHVEPGKFLIAEVTGEIFRYPSPKYLTGVPSTGQRLDLTLKNPVNNLLAWKLRIVNKSWQTTPADESARIRPLLDSRVTRLDGQLAYDCKDLFKWTSRLVVSCSTRQRERLPGYAAMQQITLGSSVKLNVAFQFILFRVDDWENRIYLYEPSLYYNLRFPVLYGHGHKTTLLFTLKPVHRITFSARISGMTNRKIQKWETAAQLRLNL